ncbi:MAG TPA: hypothetical protein VL049_19870 [Candidatus Dormibacteraeota bacterium]|nr:hypothetical protein [Candidatus Dormibacteraeota bacterium]
MRTALCRLALLLLAGCGSPTLAVQIVRYVAGPPPGGGASGCDLATLDDGAALGSGCCELGDIFVGDRGSTYPCDRDRVVKEVVSQACTLGGDTVVLREVSDSSSSCFQVRARVLRCATASAAEAN